MPFSDSETTTKSAPAMLFTIGILMSLDSLVLGTYSIVTSLDVHVSFSPLDQSSYISTFIVWDPALIPFMSSTGFSSNSSVAR